MGKLIELLKKFSKYTSTDKGMVRVFSFIFLFFGLLFVFLVPPFQTPDEQMHFYRAYQISELDIFANENEKGEHGGEVPIAMKQLVIDSGIKNSFDFGYRFDVSYRQLLSHHYATDSTKIFEVFPNTSIYSPLLYLPTALIHKIDEVLHIPMLFSLYAGRLVSLLLVLLAFLLALKYSPVAKWIFFAIGLIPMTVASAAAFSSDAITIAVTIAFITATLYVSFNKNVPSKWWLLFLASILLIGLIKQAHVALLALSVLPFIMNKSIRKPIKMVTYVAALLISSCMFLFWYFQVSGIQLNPSELVQPDLQKEFVLTQPFNYLIVLFQTFATTHANPFVEGFFGNFGWLTTPLPLSLILFSFLTIAVAVGIKNRSEIKNIQTLTRRHKSLFIIFSLGTFFAVSLLIATALYIYWTQYKLTYIQGLQGRYFLPIIPLLLIPIYLVLRSTKADESYIKTGAVTMLIIAVLIISVFVLLGRFYVATPVF